MSGSEPREIVIRGLSPAPSPAFFRFAGAGSIRDPYTLAAMKRQVNNCALAQSVWSAIRPAKDDSAASPDAGP